MKKLIIKLVLFLILALNLFLISSCSHSKSFKNQEQAVKTQLPEKIEYFAVPKPAGIVLMVHGLNTKPEKMGELLKLFNQKNYGVYLVRLSGHRGDIKEFQTVSRELWVAKSKSRKLDKPLIYVGFSMGGMLTLDLMSSLSIPNPAYDKVIQFAPSITLNWYTHLIRSFFFMYDSFLIPNIRNPYTANKHVPIGAYRALFYSLDSIYKNKFRYTNIPTLIFINHKDELVNLRRIRYVIEDYKLTNWQLIPVSTEKASLREQYNHIIIEEAALGPKEWARIKGKISKFLKAK